MTYYETPPSLTHLAVSNVDTQIDVPERSRADFPNETVSSPYNEL